MGSENYDPANVLVKGGQQSLIYLLHSVK